MMRKKSAAAKQPLHELTELNTDATMILNGWCKSSSLRQLCVNWQCAVMLQFPLQKHPIISSNRMNTAFPPICLHLLAILTYFLLTAQEERLSYIVRGCESAIYSVCSSERGKKISCDRRSSFISQSFSLCLFSAITPLLSFQGRMALPGGYENTRPGHKWLQSQKENH